MALPLDIDRAASLGIVSPFADVHVLLRTDSATGLEKVDTMRAMIPIGDVPRAILNMPKYQGAAGGPGCSGWGMDPQLLYYLYPSLFWFVGFMIIRYLCREPLARLGIYAGVVKENKQLLAEGKKGSRALTRRQLRKILKFQNQVWLSAFYMVSTVFGYCVQRDKPWFGLPLSTENSLHILLPHPYNPPQELMTYYHYGLAFYFSEVMSLIFLESQTKRSDFIEYVFHHLVTIALIVLSHIGYEHRFGAYVLFIHDASDIMLSVAKSIHYVVAAEDQREQDYNATHRHLGDGKTYKRSFAFRYVLVENFTNCFFAAFIAGFFFFRLLCLPMMLQATIGMAPVVRHGNFNMWILVLLLNGALQALHVYWGWLIVVMVVGLLRGDERKDIRSGDDADEDDELTSVPSQDERSLKNVASRAAFSVCEEEHAHTCADISMVEGVEDGSGADSSAESQSDGISSHGTASSTSHHEL